MEYNAIIFSCFERLFNDIFITPVSSLLPMYKTDLMGMIEKF